MKKLFYIFLTLFMSISCKSYFVNDFFEKEGIYDDKPKIEKLIGSNEIVIIPMHHIGTEKFYKNVYNNIDSLKKINYNLYYETILTDNIKSNDTNRHKLIDTTMLLKFRKAFGLLGLSDKGSSNYIDFFKKKGIKIKKNLIPQPNILELGLKSNLSENVDATMDELIRAYENKYGNIILEEYDYITKLTENYNRNNCIYKIDKTMFKEFIQNYRNNIVINKINQNSNKKIAIIYGKAHFIGIKDSLQKLGYKIID